MPLTTTCKMRVNNHCVLLNKFLVFHNSKCSKEVHYVLLTKLLYPADVYQIYKRSVCTTLACLINVHVRLLIFGKKCPLYALIRGVYAYFNNSSSLINNFFLETFFFKIGGFCLPMSDQIRYNYLLLARKYYVFENTM